MLMGDMMTRDVPVLEENATLERAVRLLRQSKLDGLPIIDDQGALVGIFTKANLMDAFLKGAAGADSIETFFQKQVGTISVDTPYKVIEEIVKTSPVGTGIVVDEVNNVVGIFTKVDMIMSLFRKTERLANQLSTVYNFMHNGVIVVNKEQEIQLINQPAEKLLGLTAIQTIGSPFAGVLSGLDLAPVITDAQWLIGAKGNRNGLEVICNISPIMEEDQVTGAIIIFQPLTDLDHVAFELETTKSLYETLATVLNIAYEAIIVLNDQGKISFVNEAACQFFKMSEEELLQKPIEKIMVNSRLPRTLKTGLAEIGEVQVIDGHPCIVSRNPIVRKGQVIGAVGKITYQRLEEVRELSEKLAEMDRELDYYRAKAEATRNLVTFDQIVTVNKRMKKLKEEAAMIARGASTVMLTGESGTGKEFFAEAIHNASPRRTAPFVQLNCAAIPENLAETELFGYGPGAFTGAQRDGKLGKFAVANGGTLFLDEIGDMPFNLQGKLLRVLEEQSITPIGSNKAVQVDVRIVTATNQDLADKVVIGEFRQDLYYRLNVINFKLIPLRERPEDIIPLVHLFLDKFNEEFGLRIDKIALDARNILLAHSWPGNVRELRNAIERAINYTLGSILELDSLPYYLQNPRMEELSDKKKVINRRNQRARLGREEILAALQQTGGNKSQTAKVLGISRSWLYEKLRHYDL